VSALRPCDPSRPDGLTDRQREVLLFVLASICERQRPPTYREICAELGIGSTNGATYHLTALARKGFIDGLTCINDGPVTSASIRVLGCRFIKVPVGLAIVPTDTPEGWRLADVLWGGIGLPEGGVR
jgi:SOS-response transcriptional repressor LexA